MTAVLYFTDFYFVTAKGNSPSNAGIQLLYYTPGIGSKYILMSQITGITQTVGVYLAMIMCNFYPRQTFLPLLLGSIVEATGISALTWAFHQGRHLTIAFMVSKLGRMKFSICKCGAQ